MLLNESGMKPLSAANTLKPDMLENSISMASSVAMHFLLVVFFIMVENLPIIYFISSFY